MTGRCGVVVALTWGGCGHGLFIDVGWLWCGSRCGGHRREVVVMAAWSLTWQGDCGVAVDVAVVNVAWSCRGMVVVAWWAAFGGRTTWHGMVVLIVDVA